MSHTYTITGASGNIGRVIAEQLLEQHHTVRVFGRNEGRLQPLVGAGAKPFVGDLENTRLLTEAYRGADAIFAMIPPNLQSEDFIGYADRISKAHVEAVRKAGVKRVVALSSIGAHLSGGTGVVQVLHNFENDLTALEGCDVLVLRPGYFMDNILVQTQIIKAFGFAASPVNGDVATPVVYTRDIGEMAAARLANLKISGRAIEYVLGERDITYNEIGDVLGKAIGKPDLKYVQLPGDQAVAGMTQMGVSRPVAVLLVELADAINDGRLLSQFRRTPANTTWTSIEEFSKIFADIYAR
jgi:uncharacterized protein YbjT (DUF2867 family)